MSGRPYELPKRKRDEGDAAWSQRAAASIPAEALMRAVVGHFLEEGLQRGDEDEGYSHAVASLGATLGHGSGVSGAIVQRFMGD